MAHRLNVVLKHLSGLLKAAGLLAALALQVVRADQLKVPAVVEQRARQEGRRGPFSQEHWGGHNRRVESAQRLENAGLAQCRLCVTSTIGAEEPNDHRAGIMCRNMIDSIQ